MLALASIVAMAAQGQTGTTGSTSQSPVKVQPPASVSMKAKAPAMDDLWNRFWGDLIGRTSGPFAFRFFLQPAMAIVFSLRDGFRDARSGRPAYFWSLLTGQSDRRGLLQEGWTSVARVIGFGVVMDLVYQIIVFRGVYPLELVVIVLLLAFTPYLLLRGPANRIAHLFTRARV